MHTGHDVARHKNPVFNASPVTKPMSKSAASINAHFGNFGIMLFKNCWQHQDVCGTKTYIESSSTGHILSIFSQNA